jgi:hypothetical protein
MTLDLFYNFRLQVIFTVFINVHILLYYIKSLYCWLVPHASSVYANLRSLRVHLGVHST